MGRYRILSLPPSTTEISLPRDPCIGSTWPVIHGYKGEISWQDLDRQATFPPL